MRKRRKMLKPPLTCFITSRIGWRLSWRVFACRSWAPVLVQNSRPDVRRPTYSLHCDYLRGFPIEHGRSGTVELWRYLTVGERRPDVCATRSIQSADSETTFRVELLPASLAMSDSRRCLACLRVGELERVVFGNLTVDVTMRQSACLVSS